MPIMSVSMPQAQINKLKKLSKSTKLSRSHLVQEAVDHYVLQREWEELKEYGHRLGKRLGIETDDDIEKYFG